MYKRNVSTWVGGTSWRTSPPKSGNKSLLPRLYIKILINLILLSCRALPSMSWPQFYQTRSAWSMDQGSTKKRSAVHNFVSTVTKFCVMWEGLSLPHDTKFGNCRGAIVDRRVIFIWSLIHGSSWSGLIKVGPGSRSWVRRHRSLHISIKGDGGKPHSCLIFK